MGLALADALDLGSMYAVELVLVVSLLLVYAACGGKKDIQFLVRLWAFSFNISNDTAQDGSKASGALCGTLKLFRMGIAALLE